MCETKYIEYSCGCKKDSEFIQCPDRRGTIVKCDKIPKTLLKESENYCQQHLVPPSAPAKYTVKINKRAR